MIRDANSTEPDSSLDELETKLEKMSGAICEMEAAEMANACQLIGLEIFLRLKQFNTSLHLLEFS